MSSASVGNPESSTRSAAVGRLIRSLSSLTVNPTKATNPPTPSTVSSNTNVPQIPIQNLSAFERFIQLWKKNGLKFEFPPTAWLDGQHESSAAEAASIPLPPTPATEGGGGLTREVVTGCTILEDPIQMEIPEGSEPTLETQVERPPSQMSLARKIQDMISALPALPTYASTSSASSTQPSNTPSTSPTDDNANPLPAPIADSRLISFLSSASIMNGSLSKGRQSMWSVLDRLRSPSTRAPAGGPSERDEQYTEEGDDDDGSSIMMYAPLQPDDNSEVEIARSEICSVDDEGEIIAERPGEDLNHPRDSQKDEGKAEEQRPIGESEEQGREKGKGQTKKVKEIRVWLPSTTKISIQAMWWGYRLYLPPPVLDVLNNKRLEVAKRAAIITTALKWLLDHLPVKLLPPQFRPILTVLRRLVPYLGYIGAFIAWSWGAIKTFDKGNGVILTATWLLPVALIPGAWDDELLQSPTPRHNDPVR